MIYLDSSAVVKLARHEAETDALRDWLAANAQPLASSALARIEASRALLRHDPTAIPKLRVVVSLLHQVPITDAILDCAESLPGTTLRSLDALHVATAEELGGVLTAFVAYDKRLVEAARARGLPVSSPA